ncbi:MAG: hypothetical protein JSV19_01770 [Phycisphaerales bacterium]|nr:MAG: hypothetical protein JSV19_01770 [Phycisphaerales bacterium]
MFRTAYNLVALLALIHVIALAGAGGYLLATGRLKADNIRAAAEILLTEDTDADDESAQQAGPVEEASRSEEAIARKRDEEEMKRRAEQRKVSELYQKQVAVNLLMQKTVEDLEKLEDDRRKFEEQQQQRGRQEQDERFRKTTEMLAVAKPDVAKDLLLQGSSSEDAARSLLELNARKGMKIIEAAMEDPLLRGKALQVFKLVRETAPEDSDWSKVAAPEE